VLGKDLAPPGFAPARIGMTRAEAIAANPALREAQLGSHTYLSRTLASDVELAAFFDENDRVRSVKVEFAHTPDCDKLASANWGPATPWERRIPKRSVPSWSAKSRTGWRVWVDRDPPLCTLEFVELGGASCAEVAAHAARYHEVPYLQHTDDERARIAARLVAICEADQWPRASRDCLMAANDGAAATECIDHLDNEGYMPVRAALEEPH
jgi:hypothetical protein